MDFYVTEPKTNTRIHFPMNPEMVTVSTGANMVTYDIMHLGEVKLPKGNKLDVVSWEGKLPGEPRKNMSFVKTWSSPIEIHNLLKKYKETGTKLQLLITETPINMDVYIETFEPVWGSGFGDCDYRITFTQAVEIKVYTVDEWQNKPQSSENTKTVSRPAPPKQPTYIVKPGDSLWKIAQKELGKGSRYPEIFELNKPPLKDPNIIYAGQVLKLPV
ncbi:MAG: LysM peptidoglycan-binding domain-containing protein [Firmicutes bacterium]|nr:LysM peptidoglycan-binding domain-containing protein [Bacillota bacterium]